MFDDNTQKFLNQQNNPRVKTNKVVAGQKKEFKVGGKATMGEYASYNMESRNSIGGIIKKELTKKPEKSKDAITVDGRNSKRHERKVV